MKLIEQSHEILKMDPLDLVERAGRTCYKSEEKITEGSCDKFVRMLIKRGHHAMLEHAGATVKFVTNRGVTHELVRHRLCAFGQESTRYVNYGGSDIEFIRPVWLELGDPMFEFENACESAERHYDNLLRLGWRPEQAREVLSNAIKTEIVVTTNYREWRHILALRALGTTGKPHPQMQALMLPLLKEFKERAPAMFFDMEAPSGD